MSLLLIYADLKPLIVWTGLMILLTVVQGIICFKGARLANRNKPLGWWPRGFDTSAVVIAVSWAGFSFFLVPDTANEIRNFVGFILGGAILIFIGTQNLHYQVMAFSAIIIVISRAARLVMDSEGLLGIYGAVMLLIFLVIMLGLGWMLRQFTLNGFALQWDKAQLANKLERQAEDLKKARLDADTANEAKSRFLAQASHDLRQPLHAMGLHMASLAGEKMTPKTGAVMGRISQSVEVLSKLFNSLLDVTLLDTRQLAPKPVGFDLSALIHEIADEFTIAAEAENMQVSANSRDTVIKSDPLLVRRIIQNLVSNAIRHSEGGEVFIETVAVDDDIMLIVGDTGIGIADVHKTHMFDAFVKGQTSQAGLGLGLAIVRRLTQALGVKIDVDTGQDTGTKFMVGPFPAVSHVETSVAVNPPSMAVQEGRVLVIDDDRATLEATGALLSSWGWEIDVRSHLNEDDITDIGALDLIISDYELRPGRTGLETVQLIRAKVGPIPALIITGSSELRTRQQIRDGGFLLLHKPVRPAQLRSAIISVLG